jgi:hypothetical protein
MNDVSKHIFLLLMNDFRGKDTFFRMNNQAKITFFRTKVMLNIAFFRTNPIPLPSIVPAIDSENNPHRANNRYAHRNESSPYDKPGYRCPWPNNRG